MTLIKNISGFRGTIGGQKNDNLTPIDIVSSIAAFSRFNKRKQSKFIQFNCNDRKGW